MFGFIGATRFALLCGCLAASDGTNTVSDHSRSLEVALILAVDTSGSMGRAKLQMQRAGYVKAFSDEAFIMDVVSGPTGRFAVTYIEWAGMGYHKILVPWTVIERPEDARAFAATLSAQPVGTPTQAHKATSISGGLLFAGAMFAKLGLTQGRRVIDISGDGTNNSGPSLVAARDLLVAQGITINGLPIAVEQNLPFESWAPRPQDLKTYYENCVIGGQNAFAMLVSKSDQFSTVLKRKLRTEIVASIPGPVLISTPVVAQKNYECSAPLEISGR